MLRGVPEAAHAYVVNECTLREWAIDRLYMRQGRESGIISDSNAWFADNPAERVAHLKRHVHVNVKRHGWRTICLPACRCESPRVFVASGVLCLGPWASLPLAGFFCTRVNPWPVQNNGSSYPQARVWAPFVNAAPDSWRPLDSASQMDRESDASSTCHTLSTDWANRWTL